MIRRSAVPVLAVVISALSTLHCRGSGATTASGGTATGGAGGTPSAGGSGGGFVPSCDDTPGTPTAYLGVTAEMVASWTAMKDNQHWFYVGQLDTADLTGTPNERYADTGFSAAWIYLITKDESYADKAWAKWMKTWGKFTSPTELNGNNVREYFTEGVIVASWLYETLSASERATMLSKLSLWADFTLAIGTEKYQGGFRLADSDATVGYYFGLALLDGWNVPENDRYGNLLNQKSGGSIPMGGLVATAADYESARNAIRAYVEILAKGGEWIESSEYNAGTLKLLLMGFQALNVAGHGCDFPEVVTFVEQAAEFHTHYWTSQWETVNQWGDEENPRDTGRMAWHYWPTMAMLAGLAGPSPAGERARWAVEQLSTARSDAIHDAGPFVKRAILSPWDPTAIGEPVDYSTPVVADASKGTGHYGVKRDDASLWFFGVNREIFVDHQTTAYASFKLWRDGEWVLDHPVAYGTQPGSSSGTNSLMLAGLNTMRSAGVTRVESGPDWWSMTYDTSGSYYSDDYYHPPPSFVSQATRRMVYFRGPGGWDTIVIRDDVSAENPQKLPDLARYREEDQTAINAAIARTGGSTKELIFWMPTTTPTQTSEVTEWSTKGGKKVRVVHLLPKTFERSITPGATALSSVYIASEKSSHHQLRVWPTTVSTTDVFLTVVQVGTGTPPPVSVIGAANAQVGGRQISFEEDHVAVSGG